MTENISLVTKDNLKDFLKYVQEFGSDHDDSFLPGNDFCPGEEEYPSYILLGDSGVTGAVSLLKSTEYTVHQKARFAIFHASGQTQEAYSHLLQAILGHTGGLKYVYAFLPEEKRQTRAIWESLGFSIERLTYVLKYRAGLTDDSEPEENSPEGYILEAVLSEDEETIQRFCETWNTNYGDAVGFMGIRPESLRSLINTLPGSAMVLRKGGKIIGTVQVEKEQDSDDVTIEMLSVNQEYRGRGLGKMILQGAVAFAQRNNSDSIYLCVNSHNESAVKLYLNSGFAKENVMVCYRLDQQGLAGAGLAGMGFGRKG